MTKVKQVRQGDILIEMATDEIINDAIHYKETNALEGHNISGKAVLAHGEVTGHAHAFVNTKDVAMKKGANKHENLVIVKNKTGLSHEEHKTITFTPGEWYVNHQLQYMRGEVRNMAD